MISLIANPKAGNQHEFDRKKAVLDKIANRLKIPIFGLDSKNKTEFKQIAKSLSNDFEILIVAGGDGTFSDVLNSGLNPQVTLAYLPLGSGNALRHGLELPTSIKKWYARFQRNQVKELDVILYNGSYRCFFSGFGFEAQVMQDRQDDAEKGI